MSVFDNTDECLTPDLVFGIAEENYKKIDQFVRDNILSIGLEDWREHTYEGRGSKIGELKSLYEAAILNKNEILTNHLTTLKELSRVTSERDFYKRSYEMLLSSLNKELIKF